MMLRNSREGLGGQAPENAFEMIDERSGAVLGSCVATPEERSGLFPERPYHVRLDLSGDESVLYKLLGAALARARALCAADGRPARIYAHCAPEDQKTLAILKECGFRDDDGLVRLTARTPLKGFPAKAPTGCVVVQDALEDEREQRYFMERYEEFTGKSLSLSQLEAMIHREGFRRILTVAPTGMAGEVLVWKDGHRGVVEFFDTARRWRNLGVAGYMLKLAFEYLQSLDAWELRADVRAKAPYALHTLERVGLVQTELLERYPGIDL